MEASQKLVIQIQYCGGWGYKRFYVSLMEALHKEFPGRLEISHIQDDAYTGNFEVILVSTREVLHSKAGGKGKCESAEERSALSALIRARLN